MRDADAPRLALEGFGRASESRVRSLSAQLPVFGVPPDLLTQIATQPPRDLRASAAAFYLPNLLAYAMLHDGLRHGALRLVDGTVALAAPLDAWALSPQELGADPLWQLMQRRREPRIETRALGISGSAVLEELTRATREVRWLALTPGDSEARAPASRTPSSTLPLQASYASGHLVAPSDFVVASTDVGDLDDLLALVACNLRQHGVLYLDTDPRGLRGAPLGEIIGRVAEHAFVTDVIEREGHQWVRAVRYVELAAHRRFLSHYG